uniref:PH domain-containing protein n=1 Tax=Trichogramma kaykai TaxID=54128 RepID=A0ABD2WMP4_9HYME
MDPFTTRIIERAKARREKLNTQLANTGHDVSKRPLREANILSQAPVITETIFKKSPQKQTEISVSPKGSPAKLARRSSPLKKEEDTTKENITKSKLQRLGKLYSEDKASELSSPIHKNEEKFAVEEVKPGNKYKPARLQRLAALATDINSWEDDLSHPTIEKKTVSKAERVQARMNEQVKGGFEPQPSTSGLNGSNKSNSPLRHKLDKSVFENLESKNSSSQQRSPVRSPVKSQFLRNQPSTSSYSRIDEKPAVNSKRASTSPVKSKTPEKQLTKPQTSGSSSPAVSNTRLNSRFGYNGSPKSSLVQSPGSVLSKASMFETKGSTPKTKDPTEMTLSERKALFERNKGEALIPKAPLTMSVPTNKLFEKGKPSSQHNDNQTSWRPKVDTGRAVEAQRNIFEQGKRTQELENDILHNVQAERMRELEMLRNRFHRRPETTSATHNAGVRTSESSEGKGSPKNSLVCPVKPTPAPENSAPPPPPPLPTIRQNSPTKTSPFKKPAILEPSSGSTETDTEYTTESTEPETAALDNPTDTDICTEAEFYPNDEYESDDDIGNTSLGRSILRAVSQQTTLHKKRSIEPDPDSTTSDISVLDEMDEYLDECLALQGFDEDGPTPPKLNKSTKSPSAISNSFNYSHGYKSPKVPTPTKSPQTSCNPGNAYNSPLVHSVSMYRKMKNQNIKSPVRVITRVPEVDGTTSDSAVDEVQEAVLVQEKVRRLLDDVQKQNTIIGQASQALNLCISTIEFTNSQEQVEGERLLLVASQRRQAALNEVQRLKVEGSLRPAVPGTPEIQESGSVTISAITLPLKKDFYRNQEEDTCLHFVCLVRHLETVLATPVVQAHPGDSCVRFPSTLKLQDLYSDFKVTIEVYSLQTRAEILPHDIKYHIHSSGNKKSGKTPKKTKHENKLVMPNLHSPAGASATRTTSFSLAGYMIFSLTEVQRHQFTLNKVPFSSPLEGRLQMHTSCELQVSVDHRGFLTMFEDVSGFGAWHRRWCLLKEGTISYWKYPDDERKKTPIGSLDLQTVTTTNVNLVSREICARPHTFMLETTRPSEPEDANSLIMVLNGSTTTIRHLLAADTKEDRLEWCAKLNKTLHLIRTWGGNST